MGSLFRAPIKLVPWSDLRIRTGPRLAKRQRNTLMNESVSDVLVTSR